MKLLRTTLLAFAAMGTLTNFALANPVISEFMASNARTLEDEDIDEPDWIELHNTGNTTVDLKGYYLSNDPENLQMWQVPDISIAADKYLTIFSSGKDRSDPDGVLHTNFKIPAEGGNLILVEPDGTTIAHQFQNYPAQVTDVSYGSDSTGAIGYFATPTPAEANSGEFAPGAPAEEVVFSREGGIIVENTTVTINSPEGNGAVVRYVLDPEDTPDDSSPLYSAPIEISETTTIRARVYEDGKLPGPINSISLIKIREGDELAQFSSNLPIVVVDSFNNRIDSRTSPGSRPYQFTYAVVIDTDKESGRAKITDTPDFEGRGATHVRGQSSSGFPKKQYAWEIRGEDDLDKSASILGMPEDSDWILHAPYSDKTLMRNVLVYSSARDLYGNMGAVRTRFVEVFFNQNGDDIRQSDYKGVYVLMERISRSEDRIDVNKLNELVTDSEKITGGYMFKKDKPPHDETFRTAVERQTLDFVEPPAPTRQQEDYLKDYMDSFERTIHDDDLRGDPVEGYEKYIDVQSWIDNHLFVETFKEIDGYRISAYYYKPRGGKVFALPVWDYNLGLGNADYLSGWRPQGWYYPQISKYPQSDAQYPWYPELQKDPEWEKRYWDRYFKLRETVFSKATLMGKIDAYTEELKEAQERNFEKWRILGRYVWPNASGVSNRKTHQDEVDWMKDWLSDRIDWIDSRWTAPPVMSQRGGNVPTGYQLTLNLPEGENSGTIFYTTDGGDPQPSENGKVTITQLVAEDAPVRVFVPTDDSLSATWNQLEDPTNLASWEGTNQGVGFERGEGPFVELSTTNVEALMHSKNPGIYIRLKFTIDSQEQLDQASTLTLRMKYDDGFVAFVNGEEVASANAPDPLEWNSKATKSHSDSKAILWEEFDASKGLSALRVGENVLAIHGMNTSASGSDALWIAELDGRFIEAPGGSQVHRYDGPLTLSENTVIRARVRQGEDWGAISEALFIVGAQPASSANLIISEFDYRPAEPSNEENLAGHTSRSDFEYLVLQNTSDSAVDLSGVDFVEGIRFTFDSNDPSDLVLPPGTKGILAKNPTAFAMRYPAVLQSGSGYIFLGEFSGNLSNGGEEILLHSSAGVPISQFTYDDGELWPTEADGDGKVLSITDPANDPSKPESWAARDPFSDVVIVPPAEGDTDGDYRCRRDRAGNGNESQRSSLTCVSCNSNGTSWRRITRHTELSNRW